MASKRRFLGIQTTYFWHLNDFVKVSVESQPANLPHPQQLQPQEKPKSEIVTQIVKTSNFFLFFAFIGLIDVYVVKQTLQVHEWNPISFNSLILTFKEGNSTSFI